MHKPETVSQEKSELHYPARKQRLNHYGTLVPKMLAAVSNLDTLEKKRLFGLQTAQQMKRCYLEWNKSTVENAEILSDVERLSGGNVNLEGATLTEVTVSANEGGVKKNAANRPIQQGNGTQAAPNNNKQHHHNKNKKRRIAQ